MIYRLNEIKWWEEIEEKNKNKKTEQIEIKKIRTKLDTKNKWKDTFIFQRGKERKKREEKKKVHQISVIAPPCAQVAPTKSAWQDASNVASEGVVFTIWRA